MGALVSGSIDTSGFTRLARGLGLAVRQGLDGPLGPALERCARVYMKQIATRFDQQSGGLGDWLPLKPATIKRKQQRAARGEIPGSAVLRILEATGGLRETLSPDNLTLEPIESGVRVGTEDEHAIYHDEGGAVAGQPPQRQIFVDPNDEAEAAMSDALEAGLSEVFEMADLAGAV